MSDWSKKKGQVDARQVCFCHLCGAEIVQLRFANGTPYWTDVCFEIRSHSRYVILGEGNNYNFKPQHDCVKASTQDLERAEPDYAEFSAKYEAAKTGMAQAEEAKKETRVTRPDDQQLQETLQRIYAGLENQFKALSEQKPSRDAYITGLRTKVERLRAGQTVIPADKPAVGRTAKVVKGRNVPVGTEGVIFWMGIDQYKDFSHRVGIEANGQKYYTGAGNIEITKP